MGSSVVRSINLEYILRYLTSTLQLLASSRQTFAFSRDGGKEILLRRKKVDDVIAIIRSSIFRLVVPNKPLHEYPRSCGLVRGSLVNSIRLAFLRGRSGHRRCFYDFNHGSLYRIHNTYLLQISWQQQLYSWSIQPRSIRKPYSSRNSL